jgi:hypothetical protein
MGATSVASPLHGLRVLSRYVDDESINRTGNVTKRALERLRVGCSASLLMVGSLKSSL